MANIYACQGLQLTEFRCPNTRGYLMTRWCLLVCTPSILIPSNKLCVNFLLNHAVGLPICGLRHPHLWELSSCIALGPLDHWSRVKLPLIKCFSGSVDPAGLLLRLRSRRGVAGVGWSALAWFILVLSLAHVNMGSP